MQPPATHFRLLHILTGVFVALLLISNVVSQKMIVVGPLVMAGGIVLFPFTYIFGDILTEVYGYARSRTVIWTGFACQILAALTYALVVALPSDPTWTAADQAAFQQVLGVVPRIAFASVAAYLCGEFFNSLVLSRMKYAAGGRRGARLAWRFLASTIVGEGVDTVVFVALAFTGVLPTPTLLTVAVSQYVVKIFYELVMLPFSMRFSDWVKQVEGIDHVDHPDETSYSPWG
ncbi:MAG: queuosine precursor transporter [Planctomycetia bacterium]